MNKKTDAGVHRARVKSDMLKKKKKEMSSKLLGGGVWRLRREVWVGTQIWELSGYGDMGCALNYGRVTEAERKLKYPQFQRMRFGGRRSPERGLKQRSVKTTETETWSDTRKNVPRKEGPHGRT